MYLDQRPPRTSIARARVALQQLFQQTGESTHLYALQRLRQRLTSRNEVRGRLALGTKRISGIDQLNRLRQYKRSGYALDRRDELFLVELLYCFLHRLDLRAQRWFFALGRIRSG